jgi:DNA-binding MarR family transcriptional regulator
MSITTAERRQTDPGVEDDGRELLVALDRLVRAYQFRDRQRICYHGLTIVVDCKGLTQNELAAELTLDKSTTSRLLDSLERQEYLVREPDPCDGRAYRLRASERGRRLHARIQEDLARRQVTLIEDLPKASRRAAILVLARLADDAVARFTRSCDRRG